MYVLCYSGRCLIASGLMSGSRFYWCASALLQSGWCEDVWIEADEQGNIAAISPSVDRNGLDNDVKILDGAVLPGMPNLHSHAHQRAMAGLGERASSGEDSFWTWRKAMYHTLETISPDQLYHIARMLYLEMLKAGYTRVAEFQYLHHDQQGHGYDNPAEMTLQCAQAALDVGIGFTALPVLYCYGGFGAQPPGDAQKRFINDADGFSSIIERLEKGLGNHQCLGLAPHSLRAVNAPLLKEVLASCRQDRVVHIHIAEQTAEVEDCVNWSGQRPVEWLYDQFTPDDRWCLIHATHMTETETRCVSDAGSIAGLCPTTEANLGDGLFNAVEFFSERGGWGIGSDSHISVNPVEELRWLEYGMRLVNRKRNILAGEDDDDQHTGQNLYLHAARGGARACDSSAGVLQVGARADFIALDARHPRLYGRQYGTLLDSWIFSGNDNAVSDVVVGGAHMIEAGQHRIEHDIKHQYLKTIDQLTG